MKKIILGMALIAAISLGTTVYAQNPQKKEVKKEQTVTKKKAKAEKTAKTCCTKKAEKATPSATAPATSKKVAKKK